MNHTSSLRVKLVKSRRGIKRTEVQDPLVTTPPLDKSLTTLVTKSSNGMRRQTTRRMISLKTTAPIVAVPLLQAQVPNQEEII